MSVGGRWWRTVEVSGGLAVARRPPETPTRPATFTTLLQPAATSPGLVPIAHPPDPIAQVIAHQQRSVRRHSHADRPSPLALSHEPSADEILRGSRPTVLHVSPFDFVARLLRSV